jgi:hypothetical protein
MVSIMIPLMKMDSIENIVQKIKRNPNDVRFAALRKVCDFYFGEGRQRGDHIIYKTPWRGDPRINVQNDKGKAKTYQVKQVLKAIEKMEQSGEEDGS